MCVKRANIFKAQFIRGMFMALISMSASHSWGHMKEDWIVSPLAVQVAPAKNNDPIISETGNTIDGVSFEVEAKIVPAVALTYMLSNHFAIETYLGVPPSHPVKLSEQAAAFGLSSVAKVTVASVPLLLQYYYAVPQTPITIHTGLGIVYTHFYDLQMDASLRQTYPKLTLSVEDTTGSIFQFGAQWQIGSRVTARFSFAQMLFSADAKIGSSPMGNLTSTIKVDPTLIMLGIGYHY